MYLSEQNFCAAEAAGRLLVHMEEFIFRIPYGNNDVFATDSYFLQIFIFYFDCLGYVDVTFAGKLFFLLGSIININFLQFG